MRETCSPEPNACVVLLSGGLDSATVLAIAKAAGKKVYALSFQYGQKQSVELQCARRLAKRYDCVKHQVIDLDPEIFSGCALTHPDVAVPKGQEAVATKIPVTYVPARNLLFLSYALGWAEGLGIEEIHLGINAVDYSGYPDCRPEFVDAFVTLANLATAAAVEGRLVFKVCAPLLALTKAEIIKKGVALGVDYRDTHSCYHPNQQGDACGLCAACSLRRAGFGQAEILDPTRYASDRAPSAFEKSERTLP